jgi:argininosuccinate lyase
VTRNSLSATSGRDFALDYLYVLAVIAAHLSRLAADFSLFATQEFGYICLPDEYSTGSSLMPQKKNPDVWELIRGKAGRVYAPLFALLTALKGLPTGYQRDLQEDKEPLFDAHDQTLAMLRVAAGAVAATRPNEARMREAASDPSLLATEAADYLVSKGLPFRKAHEIVGAIVRDAENRGQSWTALPLAQLRKYSSLFDDDLHGWLTVESAIARRSATGGTAPAAVAASLEYFREHLRQIEEAN